MIVEKDLGEDWFCSEEEVKKAGFKKRAIALGKDINEIISALE